MLNKETILNLLKTDKRAVARALVILHERQTHDEQAQEGTRYLNGRGFRPCHARMGSSMAKQFMRNNFLSDKQINYWRMTDKTGAMRIGIYWGQLLEEAERKAKKSVEFKLHDYGPRGTTTQEEAVAIGEHLIGGRDLGNDMEEKMVLQEIADGEQDPIVRAPIVARIDEIDDFWAKLKEKQGK